MIQVLWTNDSLEYFFPSFYCSPTIKTNNLRKLREGVSLKVIYTGDGKKGEKTSGNFV